jgi:glycosidase
MLAEAEGPEFHRNGFDMTYGWDYMNTCIKIAKGEKNAGELYSYFKTTESKYKKGDNIMYFTTDHDENSWNGTDRERLGQAAEVFAVLSATVPGMPLVYSGQEDTLNKRLAFFEKDNIIWGDYPMQDLYSRLLHLKQHNKAMEISADTKATFTVLTGPTDASQFAFIRRNGNSKVLVFVNLSSQPADIIKLKQDVEGNYTELFTGQKLNLVSSFNIHLEPYGYKVYVQQ